MKFLIFFVGILFFPHLSFAGKALQVPVNGVPHKLILGGYLEYGRYREAPESAAGYCIAKGHRGYNGAIYYLDQSGPYVLFDAKGAIAKTFEDSEENRGRFWVAESVDCI